MQLKNKTVKDIAKISSDPSSKGFCQRKAPTVDKKININNKYSYFGCVAYQGIKIIGISHKNPPWRCSAGSLCNTVKISG